MEMFTVRAHQSRAQLRALEAWREAACLVRHRWEAFLLAAPEMRTFAFASYLAALDSEAAAAADLAALMPPVAA